MFPFLLWWPLVDRATLRDDLIAGITGALIVLPQGVAFATIAGLPPQYGLYAAMIPAIVAALWGSSWQLVSGPTTAISIAVYAAISPIAEPGTPHYISLVLTLTFLVGIFQFALGVARLGALVNFISHSVLIGFTTGAALLIATSQMRNFFGIDIASGSPFYEVARQLVTRASEVNLHVVAVGVITLVTGILVKRFYNRFPYMIAAMLVGTLSAEAMNTIWGQSATGIRTVGALPSALPPLSVPDFSPDILRLALTPALVITILALTEAISISRSIAVRSEQRIDGNQEFIGQGLSNLAGAFFSSYPTSGSFNRSGINYEAGAKTPLASIFASFALLMVLLLIAPLAAYLPTAAMAGILFLVAWGLVDFRHIDSIWRVSKVETAILAATFAGTLFNLEAGIFIGTFLSLIAYLYRTSRPEIIPVVPAPDEGAYHFIRARGRKECPQLRIVRLNGSLYFGAADYVQRALQQIDEDNPLQKSVLVAAAGLTYLDIAGAEVLAQEARRRRRVGGGLYFYRLNDTIYRFLRRGNYLKDIGEGAFFPVMTNVTGALYWTLDPDVCRTCKNRIFKECQGKLLPDGFRRQRLLLASSGYPGAPFDLALELARRFGVTLDIATIVSASDDETTARDRIAELTRTAARHDVGCEFLMRHGKHIVEEIVHAADEADANILIVGRGTVPEKPHTGLTAGIAAGAHCHVLLVGPTVRMWRQRVLVATDGAASNETAFELGTQMARIGSVGLSLIALVEHTRDISTAAARLEYYAGLARLENVECDIEVVVGKPERLAETVRARNADLMVIDASRGTGLIRRLGAHSLAHIADTLNCAILLAKNGEMPGIASAIPDRL